jgi:hypothetical protein
LKKGKKSGSKQSNNFPLKTGFRDPAQSILRGLWSGRNRPLQDGAIPDQKLVVVEKLWPELTSKDFFLSTFWQFFATFWQFFANFQIFHENH